MAAHGQLVTSSPADELLSRLDEPQVVDALNTLLDHADLLALLVSGLDGLLSRGDVIADSVASGISELRDATRSEHPVDLPALAGSLTMLSGTLVDAAPTLNSLLESVKDPRVGGVFGELTAALVDGHERAAAQPGGPSGVLGLLRALKDDDVSRGLGFLIQVARALGQRLA